MCIFLRAKNAKIKSKLQNAVNPRLMQNDLKSPKSNNTYNNIRTNIQ